MVVDYLSPYSKIDYLNLVSCCGAMATAPHAICCSYLVKTEEDEDGTGRQLAVKAEHDLLRCPKNEPGKLLDSQPHQQDQCTLKIIKTEHDVDFDSDSVIVEGIRIKTEEESITDESWKLFSSTVVLRDCGAELQQSGRYCQECRVQFCSHSALAGHNRTKQFYGSSQRETTFKYSAKRYVYECDECNCKFTSTGHLKVHKRSHRGLKPFKCNHCNYRSTNNSHLKRHMKSLHNAEKNIQCNQCDYRCSDGDLLKSHKRTHAEKKFKCNQCEYRSSRSSNLQVHINTHSKPFQCNHCGYKCAEKSYLAVHLRTHAGDRPFKCNLCEYRCSRRSRLKLHSKVHNIL